MKQRLRDARRAFPDGESHGHDSVILVVTRLRALTSISGLLIASTRCIALARMVVENRTMSVETMISSLSQEEKRNALELLWASIDRDAGQYTPPAWHAEVLAERLSNPSTEPSLPLREAMDDVRRRVNERRSSS